MYYYMLPEASASVLTGLLIGVLQSLAESPKNAVHSISTRALNGNWYTATQVRHFFLLLSTTYSWFKLSYERLTGFTSWVKNSSYASFMVAKLSMVVRKMLTLTTLFMLLPASSSTVERFRNARLYRIVQEQSARDNY